MNFNEIDITTQIIYFLVCFPTVGYAKNRAVHFSSGIFLCFMDSVCNNFFNLYFQIIKYLPNFDMTFFDQIRSSFLFEDIRLPKSLTQI